MYESLRISQEKSSLLHWFIPVYDFSRIRLHQPDILTI